MAWQSFSPQTSPSKQNESGWRYVHSRLGWSVKSIHQVRQRLVTEHLPEAPPRLEYTVILLQRLLAGLLHLPMPDLRETAIGWVRLISTEGTEIGVIWLHIVPNHES